MSTLRVNTLQNTAGTGQPAMVGAAKAWVNFNGTGTVAIRAAFNVSSITDVGTGNYTVNFTVAMVDINYAAAVTAGNGTNDIYSTAPYSADPTVSALRVTTLLGSRAQVDCSTVSVIIFR